MIIRNHPFGIPFFYLIYMNSKDLNIIINV
jgi:hypothetical protein